MEFTKNKIVGLVGGVVAIIGLFLPFFTVKILGQTVSVNFIEGDGKYVLVAIIVAVVFLILGKAKAASYTFTAGAFLITFYDAFANNDAKRTLETIYGVNLKFGVGFYIILIGLIALAVSLFMKGGESRRVEQPQYGNNFNNNPFNSVQPTQPVQPVQPVQPTYSAPVNPQPVQPVEPTQPVYTQPVEPQVQQPVYPQPVQPVEPAQPVYTQPVQPQVQQPVYTQPAQPVEPQVQQPMYGQPTDQQNNNPNLF